MHPHDVAGEAQADPRCSLLRCEKWNGYFSLYILEDARSVIRDLNNKPALSVLTTDSLNGRSGMILKHLNALVIKLINTCSISSGPRVISSVSGSADISREICFFPVGVVKDG
jgi:hypothetical protein